MNRLFVIGGIALLFASCKKTKTYSTAASITIYNSNTKSNEANVKVVLKDMSAASAVIQAGQTDSNGTFSFSEFPASEGHSYEIHVYLGCGEGICHIRNGSHANYSYTITPANNLTINCPGMPIVPGPDSMRVEFKHKYYSTVGNSPEASGWFYVSNLNPLRNGESIVAFTGEYYVTIYRAKSGVLTTNYDTVVVPTPTRCVPSCAFTYSY